MKPTLVKRMSLSLLARPVQLASALLVAKICIVSAQAAPADAPLFLASSVKHSILLSIDDSGSMDFETLLKSDDGALWWDATKQTFVGDTVAGEVNFGTNKDNRDKYSYLFPNGVNSGADTSHRTYGDSDRDRSHFAIPPLPQFAFMRSPDYNKAYYDPATTYDPWPAYASKTFVNATASAAWADPSVSSGSTFNLTTAHKDTAANTTFRFQAGMVIPKGTVYYTGSTWKTASADVAVSSTVNYGIEYKPAVYYRKTSSGSFSLDGRSYQCNAPAAANFTTFSKKPGTFVGTGVHALGPDGACLVQTDIVASGTGLQNFTNWFSYYRKRHLAMRGGMVNALNGISGVRVGMYTINKRSGDIGMLDIDTQRDSLYGKIYGMVVGGGTPNREAISYAGEQYLRTDSGAPVKYACQKCFTILFTDGFASIPGSTLSGNEDGASGSPYKDLFSNSLADIAMKYYNKTLRTGTGFDAGKVPVPSACKNTPLDKSLDCNKNLHMNFYGVGLALTGRQFGQSPYFKVADAYASPPTWPDPNTERDPTQVDDFYHAAVNGRGELFSASNPKDIATKMSDVLNDIVEKQGSASAVSFNSSSLGTDTNVFQALFNSTGWSGDLISYPLSDTGGEVQYTPNWSAQARLDARTSASRVILTNNGGGKAFQWANLNTLQKADLAMGPTGADLNGEARLNFLRGARNNELPAGLGLRKRTHLLGDLIDSGPVYAGKPALNWPDTAPFPTGAEAYSAFVSAKTSRTPVVYVGANDGMLHGFNANTGEEVLAYVPGQVYSSTAKRGLHYLTDPAYTHRYYVDATPTVSDAYFATANSPKAWRTVLMGGLRGGGKGYFALDVTDPDNFGEDSVKAAKTVLWEFSHPDLGYSFSKPTIALLNNGRWAAIFGNGYDSGSGSAKLFIVYLDSAVDSTGQASEYITIDTQAGSGGANGLATPTAIDTNGDGVADRIYAGDQLGNMWAFDVIDSNPTKWEVDYESAGKPAPLFRTATDSSNKNYQPITSQPVIAKNPWVTDSASNNPNVLVMFGTGQYMNNADLSVTAGQSFYGVWDNGKDKELTPAKLVEQTAVGGVPAGNRVFTNNSIPFDGNASAQRFGWYVKLADSGERSVGTPFLRGKVVFFNTTVPSSDVCSFGGYSWLMRLDFSDGSSPESPVFDRNRDRVVDAKDLLNGNSVAGEKGVGGLHGDSGVIGNNQITTDAADTALRQDLLAPLPGNNTGRMSWQEVLQ